MDTAATSPSQKMDVPSASRNLAGASDSSTDLRSAARWCFGQQMNSLRFILLDIQAVYVTSQILHKRRSQKEG